MTSAEELPAVTAYALVTGVCVLHEGLNISRGDCAVVSLAGWDESRRGGYLVISHIAVEARLAIHKHVQGVNAESRPVLLGEEVPAVRHGDTPRSRVAQGVWECREAICLAATVWAVDHVAMYAADNVFGCLFGCPIVEDVVPDKPIGAHV